MLTLVPKRQSYIDRMANYTQTEEFSKLPTGEQLSIRKRLWASLIVRSKKQLRKCNEKLRALSIPRKNAMKMLKQAEEAREDTRDIIDVINTIDDMRGVYEAAIIPIGKSIVNLTPIWGTLFSNDDIRSLFNVSYKDMQEIEQGCTRENIIEHLLMSWWAGDTVELFGQAMFDYLQSEPKIKKKLNEGIDDFLLSLGKPIQRYNVSYDRYGEVQKVEPAETLLKRIK